MFIQSLSFKSTMRLLICLTLLGVLSGCNLYNMASYQWHNADATAAFSKNNTVSRLPFKMVNQHILVDVMINEQGPFSFVLDSGAAATVVVENKKTTRLKLPRENPLRISGTGSGEEPTAYVVHDQRVDAGDLNITQLSIIYATFESMPFSSTEEIYFDGILGADFFNCCIVEVDHENSEVLFYESITDAPHLLSDNWQELTLRIESNNPFIELMVHDGQQLKPASVMVDTGSTGTLSLYIADGQYQKPQYSFRTRSTGVQGDSANDVGFLPELKLGKNKLVNIPTYFRSEGDAPDSDSNGILGNRILKGFNQAYDFQGQRIWFKPNPLLSETLSVDRSGLRLLPHADGAILKDLAPESDAHRIKLRVQDIVTRINGERILPDNFDALLSELSREDKSKVQICWQADKKELCDELILYNRLPRS